MRRPSRAAATSHLAKRLVVAGHTAALSEAALEQFVIVHQRICFDPGCPVFGRPDDSGVFCTSYVPLRRGRC